MRLSEAIRLGAMLKPQAFDTYSARGATCAYGAAREAIGLNAEFCGYTPREWEPVEGELTLCPQCGDQWRVFTLIWHLNDKHRWTRERIADWVASIEDTLASGSTGGEREKDQEEDHTRVDVPS